MRYRIVISIIEEKKTIRNNWQKLYDDESFKDIQVGSHDQLNQYGYKPIEEVETVRTEIFSQEIEDLDIKEVVNTINS